MGTSPFLIPLPVAMPAGDFNAANEAAELLPPICGCDVAAEAAAAFLALAFAACKGMED